MSKLAISGGTPLFNETPYAWPYYGKEEAEALKKVLDAGEWGTLGKEAMAFAENFSNYLGCRYGISVTNGTVSLEIILRSLGIGYGDEVIVPSYTFYSTIASVAMTGAYPVLADTEAGGFNIDPKDVQSKVTEKTRAVIVTHLGGTICNMDALSQLCREKGLYLIEDAAHAHGSVWKGIKAGALADASSFSFQSSKNLTGGEGGFIATNDEKIFKEAWHYHHSGRGFDGAGEFAGKTYLGTNARMSEWPAAILNVQLTRLDAQIANRMENAKFLKERLSAFPFLRFLKEDERQTINSLHLLPLFYDKTKFYGISKKTLANAFCAEGIGLSTGYNPIFEMSAFHTPNFEKSTGRTFAYSGLSNTKKLCEETGLWIKGSQLLGSREQVNRIVTVFEKLAANHEELENSEK